MRITPKILNQALNFSLEFGENWLKSIDERMEQKFPKLSSAEIKYCNDHCEELNKFAQTYILRSTDNSNDGMNFVQFALFEKQIKSKYDWVNQDNLGKLYSQGCYYALK